MSARATCTAYFANQEADELLKLGEFKIPGGGVTLSEITVRIATLVLTLGDAVAKDWTGWRLCVVPDGLSIDHGGYVDVEEVRQRLLKATRRERGSQ